jgi:hypothetical protein
MEDECRRRKIEIAGAVGVIVAMVVLNDLVFGGGAFVLALAPFGWLLWSWRRLHVLRKRLVRIKQPAAPPAGGT